MVQLLEFTDREGLLIHQVGDQHFNFAILQLNAYQTEFEGLRRQAFLQALFDGAPVGFEGNHGLCLAAPGKLLVEYALVDFGAHTKIPAGCLIKGV